MRKTIGQIAIEYMRAKGYKFVMAGDAHLLHEIAEEAGIPHQGPKTEKRVLDALDRSGLFVKQYVRAMGLRRILFLPEHVPAD
jgi:hypothetical protein